MNFIFNRYNLLSSNYFTFCKIYILNVSIICNKLS
uniref:Uncharacterized protein n=1 Tax=Myoviridae sp. ctTRu92 TaxID=2825111 RepID=A0A8S5Q7B5_9CAUD|nr:MAG TPA: hypothetical protein [Myoviridae sp. ctTRu92]